MGQYEDNLWNPLRYYVVDGPQHNDAFCCHKVIQSYRLNRDANRHCMVDITMVGKKSLITRWKYQSEQQQGGGIIELIEATGRGLL